MAASSARTLALFPPWCLAFRPSSVHQVAPDRFLVRALFEGRSESSAAAAGADVPSLVHLHFVNFTGQAIRDLEHPLAARPDGVH